jgi:long-chain acyl-CoA synthetase
MAKNFACWPRGWPRSLNYPDLPVQAILENTARRVPDRIGMIFSGLELTFGEMLELSKRFSAALIQLGVKKGDRVAIHLPNSPQFAIAYYGLLRAGAVFTPLSPLLSPREAQHQLSDSGAETLLSLDLLFPTIRPILGDTKVQRIITTSLADCFSAINAPLKPIGKIPVPDTLDMAGLLAENRGEAPQVPIDPREDLAHLAYTGGTTGLPKAVMLTHFNVVSNVLQVSHWFSGSEPVWEGGVLSSRPPHGADESVTSTTQADQETALVVVPWFHAMGVVGYLNNQVYSGNTMVVFPRFDATEYLKAVWKYRATMLGGAPQLYIPLVNHPDFSKIDLSSIKVAASGAAPLARSVLDRMMQSFSGVVAEGYGLSECTMCATFNPPFRNAVRAGSVGLPLFDTEIKIVDVATGQELPPGQDGEICIKGPQVMKGYWMRPQETERTLVEGWLLTGDIGHLDQDGFLYITDRKKDMIIYKGYNVYPRELEEILFTHPAVEQCAVVGKEDEEVGEAPVAFVKLRQGLQAASEELMEHVNQQVARYKRLREIILIEQIPVSAAGKVLKKELREWLRERSKKEISKG